MHIPRGAARRPGEVQRLRCARAMVMGARLPPSQQSPSHRSSPFSPTRTRTGTPGLKTQSGYPTATGNSTCNSRCLRELTPQVLHRVLLIRHQTPFETVKNGFLASCKRAGFLTKCNFRLGTATLLLHCITAAQFFTYTEMPLGCSLHATNENQTTVQ